MIRKETERLLHRHDVHGNNLQLPQYIKKFNPKRRSLGIIKGAT
jgi:hypothetical protein